MNAQIHHIEGEERNIKQVKQHNYITSSQFDEGLLHHNTSKIFVCITVYCTLVLCSEEMGEEEYGEEGR